MPEYFAEYLPRLQSTSVQVRISPDDVSTLEVCDDEILINANIKIKLPQKVHSETVSKSTRSIEQGVLGIRLRNPKPEFLTNDSVEQLLQDQYQWNIKDLRQFHTQDSFKCTRCNNVLIDLEKVSKFLPMPSELWYEMLDFWHCHKPTSDSHKNVGLLKRFNELKPKPKSLIIGSYYLIVNPEDWDGLNTIIDDKISCVHCNEVIGELDSNFGNFKLLKWQLKLNEELFKPYSYISLKLIEEMNYSAVRVFSISCPESNRSIQIWCFGLGIGISSNNLGVLNDCLKIMYKEVDSNNTEETNGHIVVDYIKPFDDFIRLIEKFNSLLPENLRKFNDWNVSYVHLQ